MLETKAAILPVDLNHRSVTWCCTLSELLNLSIAQFFFLLNRTF